MHDAHAHIYLRVPHEYLSHRHCAHGSADWAHAKLVFGHPGSVLAQAASHRADCARAPVATDMPIDVDTHGASIQTRRTTCNCKVNTKLHTPYFWFASMA